MRTSEIDNENKAEPFELITRSYISVRIDQSFYGLILVPKHLYRDQLPTVTI